MQNIGDIELSEYTPSPVSLGALIQFDAVLTKMGAKFNSVYIADMYVPTLDSNTGDERYTKTHIALTVESLGYTLNNDKMKTRKACVKMVSTSRLFFIILPVSALLNMTIQGD